MTSEPINHAKKVSMGCIFLVQYSDFYRIGALQPMDGKIQLVRKVLKSWPSAQGKLVHVIYTDNLCYLMERLYKHFHWKRTQDDRFILDEADVAFFKSIRSDQPMKILQQMLPGLTLPECQSVYKSLQMRTQDYFTANVGV